MSKISTSHISDFFITNKRKIIFCTAQIVVVLVFFSGGILFQKFVLSDANSASVINKQPTTENKTAKEKKNANSTNSEEPVSNQNAADSQQDVDSQYFTFIEDRSNWQTVKSIDESYSIMFGPNETFGFCKNDTTTILVGMIFMNGLNSGYDCNGVTNALSSTNPRLTRVAFGIVDERQLLIFSVEKDVILDTNIPAKYYEYSTEESGKGYNIVEYRVSVSGKNYLARLKYEKGYNLNEGSNISVNYFNTIVQKTWKFYN